MDAKEVLDWLEYLDGDAAWKVCTENFVHTTFMSNHRQQDQKPWCLLGSELASKRERKMGKAAISESI